MDKRTFDPRRDDFAPYGFTCDLWQLGPMPRADRHNEIELNLLTEGGFTYLIGGRREQIDAGRLTLFWAATPHQIVECTRPCTYFVATIPLAWFLAWGLGEPFVQAVLAGEVVRTPGISQAQEDSALLGRWTEDFARPSPQRLRTVALEAQARVCRLSLDYNPETPAQAAPTSRHPTAAADRIEAMAAWIAQHYREPLRLRDIGAAVGLHPNYAARLFREAFGTTINAYITAHRVAHAQRLLMLGDDKILAVALASGFNSLSRFNAAFRQACGCTPREYRRLGRPLAPVTASPGAQRCEGQQTCIRRPQRTRTV